MYKAVKMTVLAVAASALMAGSAAANDFAPQITEVINSQVKPWLSDPAIVEAIKAQNAETAGLGEGDIDALDKQWRAEAKSGSGPLVDKVLSNSVSALLKSKKDEAGGLFSEIFIMDAKGLNVGQSDVTSDYMQGDEAKWKKTYATGPDAVFIDEVEFDDSSQQFQSQANLTIVDPATGKAIGAITVGVNVEQLP